MNVINVHGEKVKIMVYTLHFFLFKMQFVS